MKLKGQVMKLGEICDFQGGSQPPKSDFIYEYRKGYVRFLQIRDFASDKYLTFIPESKKNRYCNEDDILLGRYGASVGKVLVNKAGAYNVAVLKTIPDESLLVKRYLFYYLSSSEFQTRLLRTASRSAQDGFSKDDIYNFPIFIPSLDDQKEIIAVLDKAFAAIDKAKANTEKNLQNVRELYESYLEGIFEDEIYDRKSIHEITRVINGFAFSSKDFKSTNKVKSIKITNVGVGEFVQEDGNCLPEIFRSTYSDFMVKKGNIVIALTRTIISDGLKVALVPQQYDGALVNQRVAALIVNEKLVNHLYLFNYLQTTVVSKYVLAHVNTLMQPNLSINDLKKLHVPCPSIDIQNFIVEKLEIFKLEIRRLENIYWKKLESLEEMRKSLLARAFSGEL